MTLSAPQIGPILQRHRKARGLTLQQVATLSNVSKSMLSEIERGEANPTFAVLWSLTRGLQIDFSTLLQGDALSLGDSAIEIVSGALTPEIRSSDGSCRLRILNPPHLAEAVEWYAVEFARQGRLDSAAHAAGTVEHFTVLSGEVVIASGLSRFAVTAGATARYPVDVPHSISNELDEPAHGLVVLVYQNAKLNKGAS